MRTTTRLAILALALGLAPAARADVKLGFADIQRAIKDTGEGKAAVSALEKDFNERKKVLEGREKELQKSIEDFQKQKSLLTKEVAEKKQAELQGRIEEFQESKFKQQQELSAKEATTIRPLADKMFVVLRDLAQAEGYTMVFDHDPSGARARSGILYAPDAMDLTNELIRKYDVRFPAGKAAAAPAAPAATPAAAAAPTGKK
jgi:outer membrane protein